jgi:hypothetical protein
MRSVAGGVAVAMLAVSIGYAEEALNEASPAEAAPIAQTISPSTPQLLMFSGADIWHSGGFAHAGLLWSPDGLEKEGFTLKVLGGAGSYRYRSGALGGAEVKGIQMLGSLMPGWRVRYGGVEITAYAGLDIQNHRLTPDDLSSAVRGTRFGVRGGADVWYEPLPATMMTALNVSVSSIGPSYWTRAAAGWRLFDLFWLGPEAQALGGPTYQQWRAGLHATSFKTGNFEWSLGGGFARDSDHRNGFYGRLGVLTRR